MDALMGTSKVKSELASLWVVERSGEGAHHVEKQEKSMTGPVFASFSGILIAFIELCVLI